MSFIGWLVDKFGGKAPLSGTSLMEYTDEYVTLYGDVYIRELAFWSCVNIIANAVSKCEFKTFEDKKEIKGREYYLWNVEPNKNQNSSGFIHQWLSQLYRDNECLVIENNGQLLVADSFIVTPYALYDDVFSQVTVKGFTFARTFTQSEVLYFKLSEQNMQQVVAGLYESYSKLITYSMRAFQKSRGTKGVFKYEAFPAAGSPDERIFNDLINNKIQKWLSGDNAALPLGKGQDWKELQSKTYASESTRDIRAMIDDISDFTARGFGIPPALIRGDVQDTSKAVKQLLTFCVDPLVDMLAEEINRKRNGYKGFAAGTYLVIDTKTIEHIDLLSVASSIDKLIGSGAYCINDIRRACGDTEIDEPWAWKHFMTKNYSTVEDVLKALDALGLTGGDGTG